VRKITIYDGRDDPACFWLNRINLIKERGACQGILVLRLSDLPEMTKTSLRNATISGNETQYVLAQLKP
jgi:hypothetical protein